MFKASSAFESQTGSDVKTWYKTFASYNRSNYKPSLKISWNILPTSVTISPTSASAMAGGPAYSGLTATVAPDDAYDKTVIWSSSNPNIACIDRLLGNITPLQPGITTISCRSSAGDISSTSDCIFTVTPGSGSYTEMFLGTTYNREISPRIHLWHTFTPTETGTYTFESTGSTDTYAFLYEGETYLWSDNK